MTQRAPVGRPGRGPGRGFDESVDTVHWTHAVCGRPLILPVPDGEPAGHEEPLPPDTARG
ncbi:MULTISPECIES: hypothetical protein [Streptomyces]|uniref:Uncharacterized protein n=2 Tax=Streptomyces TaxID=1883 RepID=A0A1I6W8B8_9ACTN|nr:MULTISPECIES: hypothetical protein [Streptomyces]QKV69045.1 hypothetical protein HUT13_09800 [Streptomyces harbinensis]SFT22267.1 hypothetical protein SAMN05444716_11458 [Streptomyces harbinensis]